ncbi:hypothetical protein M514_06701, partial [Trichuris suis]
MPRRNSDSLASSVHRTISSTIVESTDANINAFEGIDERTDEASLCNTFKSATSKGSEAEKLKESNDKEPKLRRATLEQTGKRFVRELYNVVSATEELNGEITAEEWPTLEHMNNIQTLLRPNLERLDENILHVDQFVQVNFSQCRNNDPRARWLLLYHKAMVKLRQIERHLAVGVMDELERIIVLKLRGCDEIAIQPDFNDELRKIANDLKRLDEHLQDDLIGWLPINEF